MPSRPNVRRHAVVAVTTAVVVLSACTGGGSDATSAPPTGAPPGPVLDATGLAGLADAPAPTALPASTQTTARTEERLVTTLPEPQAVAGEDAASVRAALRTAAHLLAVTRADRRYLCGPRSTSPLTALSAPSLRPFLADPRNEGSRRAVEVTVGAAAEKDDCGTLRWVGPGVVVGPQEWSVEPGRGGVGLTVRWKGTLGYALADPQGRPESWGLSGHVGYGLVEQAGGWRLATWTEDTYTRVSAGWPHDVPVPDGYLPVAPVPAGDPAALDAVRGAAAAWRGQQGSTTKTDARTTGGGGTAQGKEVTRLTATANAAPARGDASSSSRYDGGGRATRTLHLDGGRRSLSEVTGRPVPVPGTRQPARLLWTSTDNTEPGDGNASWAPDPFAAAALLGEVDAAAPAPCPDGLAADRCYTAVVVTADGGDPLAGQLSGVSHRAGRPHLVLDVGLDAQGRPAHLRLAQDVLVLGGTGPTLTGTTRFTGYPATAPPPVTAPDPGTVVDADDVDF